MSLDTGLTIDVIRTTFAEEIEARGGNVSETFEDDSRLFARSILPWLTDVRPQDRLRGGVALRATQDEIYVHPYVFRQVCRNGAIIAKSIQSTHLVGLNREHAEDGRQLLREAIRSCASEDAFVDATEKMRTACDVEADTILNIMPMLSRLSPRMARGWMTQILQRFTQQADRSRFGFANAITSLARDTRDSELKWRLEELGGAIAVALVPNRPAPTIGAELTDALVR